MQLPPPRCGDFVIAGLAVVLGSAPERRDEALVLEPVQGRIERPLLHLQHRIAAFLNELGYGVAVRGAEHERLEDEHVERALHQIPGPVGRFAWTHEPFSLPTPLDDLGEKKVGRKFAEGNDRILRSAIRRFPYAST